MQITLSLLLFVMCASVNVFPQDTKASVDGLAWMAGCWELSARNGAMVISEHWMKPSGGSLIGMSRTVQGGKTVSYEFLRIVQSGAGIAYIAKPSSNRDETSFKLVKSSANEAVFENLAHDFPQRVIYRNDKPDSLFARIEGMQNGKLNGMDIPMTRAKCN